MSRMKRIFGLVAGLAMVLALAYHPAAKAQVQGLKWEKAAPFPEAEEELYGTSLNGKMYVFGGFGQGGHPVGMAWEYDPNGDKWTKKKTMPIPSHHSAVATYGNKIYLFGGFTLYTPPNGGPNGWEPTSNAWEYDPATDNWKAIAPVPTRRGSPVAITVGNEIYVIGGATMNEGSKEPAVFAQGPSRSITTNEAYNPESNKWTPKNPMPTPRNHMYAGAVNGKIYVIGGRIANPFITVASNLDIVEEYDTATDQWGPQKTRMPTARSGGGFATFDGKIYCAGGEVQTPQYLGAFRALEAYDAATNSWSILPYMPLPRHGVATAFIGNKLHLVSGKITSGGAPDVQLATASHDVLEIK